MKILDRAKQRFMYRKFDVIKSFGANHHVNHQLSISFCDLSAEVTHALHRYFHEIDHVEILQGNILNLQCDALVSPANSFGKMSGGLDKAIDEFYERKAQSYARRVIAERFFGELPVGMAIILSMETPQFPFLVVAPSMRIPGNVQNTINAYLAMRAVLVAIVQHNRNAEKPIKSVAIPGFCSGVGGMAAEESASQMRTAYEMILQEKWKAVVHPALAPYALRDE